jgi:formate/nitrite transporter FocA (FNT family)
VAVDAGLQTFDEIQHSAQRTFGQHLARVGLSVLKAGAIIGAGVVAGLLIGAAVVSAPVWVPIAAGIVAGLAIGYVADKATTALIQADPRDVFGKGD